MSFLKYEFNIEFNDYMVYLNGRRVQIRPEDGELFNLCIQLNKDYQKLARIQEISMMEEFAETHETLLL